MALRFRPIEASAGRRPWNRLRVVAFAYQAYYLIPISVNNDERGAMSAEQKEHNGNRAPWTELTFSAPHSPFTYSLPDAFSRSTRRRILPMLLFGSACRKWTCEGALNLATCWQTWSITSVSHTAAPGLATTKATTFSPYTSSGSRRRPPRPRRDARAARLRARPDKCFRRRE